MNGFSSKNSNVEWIELYLILHIQRKRVKRMKVISAHQSPRVSKPNS